MPETNIVVLHDHTPQRISLPDHPPFLLRFSRRHRSSHDVCITTKPTSLLLLLLLLLLLQLLFAVVVDVLFLLLLLFCRRRRRRRRERVLSARGV